MVATDVLLDSSTPGCCPLVILKARPPNLHIVRPLEDSVEALCSQTRVTTLHCESSEDYDRAPQVQSGLGTIGRVIMHLFASLKSSKVATTPATPAAAAVAAESVANCGVQSNEQVRHVLFSVVCSQ